MNTLKAMQQGQKGRGTSKMSFSTAARQLGFDPEEFGSSAEGFWQMLNDLAETNPEGYRSFIEKQMEEAKEAETMQSRKGFRPKASKAFQTSYVENGQPVIINLCHFEGVEPPQDAAGNPVETQEDIKVNFSGLNIPLAVSPFRRIVLDKTGEEAIALDVVVNPWVTLQCAKNQLFRTQVIELALTWCEQEARGKLSRKYEELSSPYVGFEVLPNGSRVESFFVVEEEDKEKGSTSKSDAKSAVTEQNETSKIETPTDLIGILKKESDEEQSGIQQGNNTLEKLRNVLNQREDGGKQEDTCKQPAVPDTSKSLIQEITPTSQPGEPEGIPEKKHARTQRKENKQGAVKKGFLNKPVKESLYPSEGSLEGKPKSLYEKAKIVDLNKLSPEEVKSVMKEHASPAAPQSMPKPTPKPQTNSNNSATMQLFEEAMKGFSGKERDMFQTLAEAADEEFGFKNIVENQVLHDQMTGLFGDFAKALGMNVSPEIKQPPSTDEDVGDAESTMSGKENVRHSTKVDEKAGQVVLKIELPKVSSMNEVDVEISEKRVLLAANQYYHESVIRLPRQVQQDSARAKFSKKNKTLTITGSFAV